MFITFISPPYFLFPTSLSLLPKQFPNLITASPAVLGIASLPLLQLDYLPAFHGLRRERTVLQIPITNMTSATASSCAIWRDAVAITAPSMQLCVDLDRVRRGGDAGYQRSIITSANDLRLAPQRRSIGPLHQKRAFGTLHQVCEIDYVFR